MSKTTAWCALIVGLGVVMVISIASPELLSQNAFLAGFVNHELIAIMGVIATITLASTSQIHLTLNSIEERMKRRGLNKTRAGVRQAAYGLLFLLGASVLLVTIKPWFGNAPSAVAFCHGLALWFLLWSVLILISITSLVFAIGPMMDDDQQ